MMTWDQQAGVANAAIIAAFGQPVSYKQAAGAPFSITAVLDKRSDEERHPDTLYARAFVRLADFSVPPDHGDEITITVSSFLFAVGAVYTVFEVLNDNAGGCWLSLRLKS
jgi:hypothetical protein